jgi:hypothetical protein
METAKLIKNCRISVILFTIISFYYSIQNIQKDFTIEDATGKSLMAKTVFTLSIRYLINDLMGMSKKQVLGENLTENDIKWVLTVPAIWNDVAKQFMREAAEDVRLSLFSFVILLSPTVYTS